jgi:hypothetical protein
MSSNLKTNEWNSLKEEFDALARNKVVREDNLEQVLDKQIRRRFGELIAWAAGHKAKGYHGPWPPGPLSRQSVAASRKLCGRPTNS